MAPPSPSGLPALASALRTSAPALVSTDLFDTVLLRDHTTETVRLAEACRRAAPRLGIDAAALTALRWSAQDAAYQAVALERPDGDAVLGRICAAVVAALGRGDEAARVLHDAEIAVDVEHLRPNRALLRLLQEAADHGRRVVAVSDTYYSGRDLEVILAAVVGPHPLSAVHCSADVGLTKHAGGLFREVAQREGVDPMRILHVGDDLRSDVRQARAAGWDAIHLPRRRGHAAARLVGRLLSAPAVRRRFR